MTFNLFSSACWIKTLAVAITLASGTTQAALNIETWTTSRGSKVVFVRADTIPMLDINIDFDAGSRHDPKGKAGLASVTQALLGKGAIGLDEAALADAFADIGAQRGGGAGDDRASMSLRSLVSAAELEAALALTERILAEPSFPAAVLNREKLQIAQSLREALTKPESIANRAFSQALYGEHPYAREASPESIEAITLADVQRFHARHYAAKRAVVAMVGAITRAQAELIAERLVKRLPEGELVPALPEVVTPTQANDQRIAHPASQSHISIGLPALARVGTESTTDFFPFFVGNYILGGGGFVSRLTDEVREKRGLAYSVYSYIAPGLQAGPFAIGLQTQKEQTETALKVVRDTLTKFVEEGPTEVELKAAKDNLIGGFALRIDSNRKILDNIAMIAYFGLPLDYLDRWTQRVDATSVAQVKAVFQKWVKLDRLVTVVVGAGN
jgi:zinc protease